MNSERTADRLSPHALEDRLENYVLFSLSWSPFFLSFITLWGRNWEDIAVFFFRPSSSAPSSLHIACLQQIIIQHRAAAPCSLAPTDLLLSLERLAHSAGTASPPLMFNERTVTWTILIAGACVGRSGATPARKELIPLHMYLSSLYMHPLIPLYFILIN